MITRILFICLGNICRSPAAEGIMRQMLEERTLYNDIIVDSAGIGSWHVGEMPDPRMRKHAALRCYDLSPLRARQFRADDFQKFDYIIVMDEENYHDVMERGGVYADARKVLRMKDYFIRYKGQQSVPDPYYGGAEGFERALNLIEDGCEGLLKDLVNKIKG
jgi:protein-tyrosine phosphatase